MGRRPIKLGPKMGPEGTAEALAYGKERRRKAQEARLRRPLEAHEQKLFDRWAHAGLEHAEVRERCLSAGMGRTQVKMAWEAFLEDFVDGPVAGERDRLRYQIKRNGLGKTVEILRSDFGMKNQAEARRLARQWMVWKRGLKT